MRKLKKISKKNVLPLINHSHASLSCTRSSWPTSRLINRRFGSSTRRPSSTCTAWWRSKWSSNLSCLLNHRIPWYMWLLITAKRLWMTATRCGWQPYGCCNSQSCNHCLLFLLTILNTFSHHTKDQRQFPVFCSKTYIFSVWVLINM